MASFPDISDYTDSVQNAARQVIDHILRNATPRLRGGKPEMMSGGVAVVYPFQDGGNIYAVKCWLRDIADLRDHYRLVHSFLSSCKSSYFVDFAYVEKGIIAKDQIWPFLRMKWVGGKNLLEFVTANVSNGPALVLLAERYLTMSQWLHKNGVAHGDLQGSNIKVVGSGAGIDFKLIDYDTLVVPASHGRKADVIALPSYQHPKRGASRYYNGKEDYFSELAIYLSLLAVAERPSMWSKYPKGDPGLRDEDRHDKEMLFVKEDFLSDRPTEVFKELFGLSPVVKNFALILWNFTRASSIEQLLPLEEAVKLVKEADTLPSQARRKSEFETLLTSPTSGSGNWLDDSALGSPRKQGGTVRTSPSIDGAGKNFNDWLREIAPTAPVSDAATAKQNGTTPKNALPVETIDPGTLVFGLFASLALLAIIILASSPKPAPPTSWRQESNATYDSSEIREKTASVSTRVSALPPSILLPSPKEALKKAADALVYDAGKDLFPTIKANNPPHVPILNVPIQPSSPSVPPPDTSSQATKASQPDFSIYDASLLRFLRSEHPDWMAGMQQIPRPKYLGRLGMELFLAVKFVQPYSPGMTSPSQWYAQMRVRDEQWQALSPAESYQMKGVVVADFCVRHPASLATVGGVITAYIEGLNSRRLEDLLSIYSEDAVWVERGSKASDRSVFEGNLRRTYQAWPRSRVDVSTEPEISEGTSDESVNLQFRTRFRLENPESGKWIEGTRSTRWQMTKVIGWRVVREESTLVTPPYEGVLANAASGGGLNRSPAQRAPETALPDPTRTTGPPLLRVVNVKADDWLALRIIPDERAKNLAYIPHNATGIEKTGESRTNGQDLWVPVRWNGINGWANGNFLKYE